MSAPLVAVLLIGEERILVEFTGKDADAIRHALATSSAARLRQLERSVRGYRAENPDAPANEVVRVVGGNRQDVLDADRRVTGREKREAPFPRSGRSGGAGPVLGPGNHANEAAADGDRHG
jgi:hypothetical protein